MTRRDIIAIVAAIGIALGVSAILYVGTLASEPPAASQTRLIRPRIFFDLRNPPPPLRSVSEVQERVGPFAIVVPLQRGVSDAARDAAGLLLVILVTAATLVIAQDRVISAYRASLGGWRTQLRILLTGLAVLGLASSASALAWVVYLGYVTSHIRATAFGVAAALQFGLAAFGVIVVILLAVLAVGFAATAWRIGDVLFRPRRLAPLATAIPATGIALIGAAILYLVWQLPAIGTFALALATVYALGVVVTARFAHGGTSS